jgi:hypothetical protein
VTASEQVSSLDKVRLFMETADGEFGLSALRQLAVKRPQVAEYSPEELDLLTPEKQWAVLAASGLVRMGDFLDARSREHVHAVAEAAYDEIDSRRPKEYWINREIEEHDEFIDRVLDREAGGDEPGYLDTESYDDE